MPTLCVALMLLGPTVDRSTPEATIRSFVAAAEAGNARDAATCIVGADPSASNPCFSRMGAKYRMHLGIAKLRAVVKGDSAVAKMKCSLSLMGRVLVREKAVKVNLMLQNGAWLIGPLDWGWVFKGENSAQRESPEAMDPFQFVADIAANPMVAAAIVLPIEAQMDLAKRRTQALMDAKKIAMACMEYMVDNDDAFPKDVRAFRADVLPYLAKADRDAFTAPGDPPGTVSFSMNPYLAGRHGDTDVEEPHRTVLIYLGKDKKLDFRYHGKAAVAFVDGSARLVAAEQAASLRWKP